MLRQIRGATRGWVSGVFLFIMAALFVFFLGNGSTVLDAFKGVNGRNVATVAGGVITPEQLDREIELTLRRMRNDPQNAGQSLSRADAIKQGMHRQLLEQIIQRRAVSALARNYGIHASDAQVAEEIRAAGIANNPMTGTFDRAQYQEFLSGIRYSQLEFENERRDEIATAMLMQALTEGTRAPNSFGELLLAWSSEQRIVSVAQAPAALAASVPPPTDAQIQQFYRDNQANLRTPEYRALTLVFARPADFEARVNITDEQLHQQFEAHRASLTTPEKRSFVQISAPDQAHAQQAATRLAHGEAAEAVAQSMGLQLVRGNDEARTAVADANVAAAVFGMARGAAPAAVRGALTPWAAVQLVSITPGVEPNFENERDSLREQLTRAQASDDMSDAMTAFDTARSGGASVADAARSAHLTVVAVPAVDARGLTPQGQPAEGMVDQPRLIQTAFATGEGEASDFMDQGDQSYALVSVDRITPEATRPFDSVKTQLTQLWIAQERARRLTAIGDEVKEAVGSGQTFAAAARAHHLQMIATSQPLTREAAQRLPARALGADIFNARAGDVVSDMRVDGGGLVLAIVEDIRRTDPAQARPQVEQFRQRLQQSLGQSLVEAIVAEAVARAKPKRNEAELTQGFSASGQGDATQQQQ